MLNTDYISLLVNESMPYDSKRLVKPQKKSILYLLKLRKLRVEAKKT